MHDSLPALMCSSRGFCRVRKPESINADFFRIKVYAWALLFCVLCERIRVEVLQIY